MITLSESGLTQEQYNKFQSRQFGPDYKVELHRYDFDFEFDYQNSKDWQGSDYATASNATHLIRVHGDGAYEIHGSSWSSGAHTFPAGTPLSVSLKESSGTWYWYMAGTFGVYRCSSTDNGATWSSWSMLQSSSTLLVSGVDTRYWTVTTNSQGNGIVKWYTTDNPSGDTDLVFSSIPRSIDSLAWDGKVVMVVAMDIPGRTTMTMQGNTPVRHVVRSGGILGFIASNKNVSEEIEIDLVDQYTSFRYRESVRLSYLADKLIVTCAASDGHAEHSFRSYRYYTTKDGKHWSAGKVLHNFSSSLSRPVTFEVKGDSAYLLDRKKVWISPATYITGNSTVVYDITDRVLALQSQQQDMRQSGLVISNEDDFLDTIKTLDATWTVVTSIGYESVGLIQYAVEEIDSWSEEVVINGPEHIRAAKATCRDRTAWMTDDVTAEEPKYWQAQLAGADVYEDTTGSGYGGMAHTATQSSSWRTVDNTLLLTANNEEGVAFSTFDSAIWNGGVEYGFRLSLANNREYAGVCFRAIDKDNLWAAWYDQASDRILLIRRMSGSDSIVASSSALGWGSVVLTGYRFIRAIFKYARVYIETSVDGMTWDRVISYTTPGNQIIAGESMPINNRIIERGFVGCIGKGYSTLDYWEVPGWTSTIEFIDWTPSRITETVVLPEETSQKADTLIWVDRGDPQKVYRAVLTESPSKSIDLTDITPSSGILDDVGEIFEVLLAPWDATIGYLFCEKGIVKTVDVWGTVDWEILLEYDPIIYDTGFDITGTNPTEVSVMPTGAASRKGFWAWSVNNTLYITKNDFKDIESQTLEYVPYCIAFAPYNKGSKGEVWIAAGGEKPGLYKSTDWLKTISLSLDSVVHDGSSVKPEIWTWVEIPKTLASGKKNLKHEFVTGSYALRSTLGITPESPIEAGWWRKTLDLRVSMSDSEGGWVNFPGDNRHNFEDFWFAGVGKVSGPGRSFTMFNQIRYYFANPHYVSPQTLRVRMHYHASLHPGAVGVLSTAFVMPDGGFPSYSSTVTESINGSNLVLEVTGPPTSYGNITHIDAQISPQVYYFWGALGSSTIFKVEIEGNGTPPTGMNIDDEPPPAGAESVWEVYTYDLWLSPYNQRVGDSDDASENMTLPINYRQTKISPVRGNKRGAIVTDYSSLIESEEYVSDDGIINYYWMRTTTGEPLGDWDNRRAIYAEDDTYLVRFSNVFGFPTNPNFMGVFFKPTEDRKEDPDPPKDTRFYITDDEWATYEDWTEALEDAYGTTVPEIRSVVANVSSIVTTIEESETEEFIDDDFPPIIIDDWLDDSPGYGVWIPGPETALQFCRNRVYNRAPARTVEDIFKAYGGFAGIHSYKFLSLIDDTTSWTDYSGTNISAVVLPHNYRFSFESSSISSNTVYLNLRSPNSSALTQVHYRVQFGAYVTISKYIPGTGYTTVVRSGVAPVGNKVEISVREIIMRSIGNNVWLVISVYVDGNLYETYCEWIKESPETNYYVGMAGSFSAPHIPQMCNVVEWNSMDPGDPVMSGLQRAIEGRNIRFNVRFNESISAWIQTDREVSQDFSDEDELEGIQLTLDYKSRITHVRMVGAYKEAEAIRSGRGRHRFVELKNPYLMTHLECLEQALKSFDRFDQVMETASFAISARPLLEIGDRITLSGYGDFYIDGIAFVLSPAQIEMNFNLRRYTGAS